MTVDFDRERDWWDAKATTEDSDHADEVVNRRLRWREIDRHLGNVRTILDVGAATGRFSIPLAKRGYDVTHFDISSAMISAARDRAGGLANIQFVQGNAVDLSQFGDRSFDLVLNTDGAISFCGTRARYALEESCRVCKSRIITSVSHKAQMIPSWLVGSYQCLGRFVQAVDRMIEHGDWHQQQYPENEQLTKGLTQNYMGTLKSFLPEEIEMILERQGMSVIRCGGLGSLAGMCPKEFLDQIVVDRNTFEKFLDYCEHYDIHIMPEGPGTRQRAGLIAVATRNENPA